jgi:hypothetical protein
MQRNLITFCLYFVLLKIHGWFYLLQEDIGELRHKQVFNHDEKQVTKINRDIADLEEYQVNIYIDNLFVISRSLVDHSTWCK